MGIVLRSSDLASSKRRRSTRPFACRDDGATLDDFREAATTLEETTQAARRVLGGAHPVVTSIENSLRTARGLLALRETQPLGL